MLTYDSLFTYILQDDTSLTDKPLAPVEIGMEFKFKDGWEYYRRCIVTSLNSKGFEYEFINTTLRNPTINKMYFIYLLAEGIFQKR